MRKPSPFTRIKVQVKEEKKILVHALSLSIHLETAPLFKNGWSAVFLGETRVIREVFALGTFCGYI